MKLVVEVGDEKIPWSIYRWWFDSDGEHKYRFEDHEDFIVKIEVDGEIIFNQKVQKAKE